VDAENRSKGFALKQGFEYDAFGMSRVFFNWDFEVGFFGRQPGKGDSNMAIKVTSTAFKDGDIIPKQYTCDGNDISPPLTWSEQSRD
jgi:hypothetical protein